VVADGPPVRLLPRLDDANRERQVSPQPEVAAVANGGGPIAGAMLLTRGGG
jgi:hypothetical protein